MDRRVTNRRPISVLGHVLTGAKSVFCRVLDLSDSGARVKSAHCDAIPDRFDLEVPSEGLHRAGEVQWRKGSELGIKFK